MDILKKQKIMKTGALIKKISWLTFFSIAMGFMETVIVVYLRKLYYPYGFQFPLVTMDEAIIKAEVLREAATIIMLLAIGILTGKTRSQKFAIFIYCFAIWDIFYYVFLKVLLDWPDSLFTWDILFLIPVPWVGPVIAPCIVSLTMIALAFGIICLQEKSDAAGIEIKDWLFFTVGSILIILSFVVNAFSYTSLRGSALANMSIPTHYDWTLFIIGECIIILGIIIYFKRNGNENQFNRTSKESA
jgi:hypothetical protein